MFHRIDEIATALSAWLEGDSAVFVSGAIEPRRCGPAIWRYSGACGMSHNHLMKVVHDRGRRA